jgi:hemoglobin-like flavoprotein
VDTDLLRASFARIEPRKEAFAETFYMTLLEQYPALHQFFVGVDLKRQQTSLIATLRAMLNESEQGEALRQVFQHLGERHAARKIGAEHYPAFGQVLLETLATYDPAWTAELRAAWAATLEGCVRFMMESYHPEATVYRVQISNTKRQRSIAATDSSNQQPPAHQLASPTAQS